MTLRQRLAYLWNSYRNPAHVVSVDTLRHHLCPDPDTLMLHACFHVLASFMESHEAFHVSETPWFPEAVALYTWWKQAITGEQPSIFDDERFEEHQVMLKRLIDIRPFLWV